MHIAAMNPKFIKPEDVSAEIIEKEKEIWQAQLVTEGKKPEMIEKNQRIRKETKLQKRTWTEFGIEKK
jgi:translation elongation factor EF-Ts